MKKILFCTSSISLTQTGAAVFAQLFLEWASVRSIHVDIISPETNSTYKSIPFVKHRKLFTQVPILQTYHRSFIYYKTVKQQIDESTSSDQPYDLVFFNSVVESLHSAKLIHKIPVWAFLHDENFMRDYVEKPSWKRYLYRRLMHRFEGKAVQFLEQVITNSKYMKKSIVDIYSKHPIQVKDGYFRSFDLPGLATVASIGDTINILFIKHDADRGGLALLLNEITKMKTRKISLHLVGVAPSYIEKYKSVLSSIEYQHDTYLNRDELHHAFLKTDIFCVPSFSEALGLANFEALQYSKPVIVLDIPVMRELVEIEPMYFFATAENLGSTIEQVVDDAHERLVKCNSGHKFLNEYLSKTSVFSRWDDIFDL